MRTQEVKQLIIEAHFSGSIAFKEGKPCISARDRKFIKKADTLPFGSRIKIRVLEEWIRGYTVAMTAPMILQIHRGIFPKNRYLCE